MSRKPPPPKKPRTRVTGDARKPPPPKKPRNRVTGNSRKRPPPPPKPSRRHVPPPRPPAGRGKRPKPPFKRIKENRRLTYMITPIGGKKTLNRQEIATFFDPTSVRNQAIKIVRDLIPTTSSIERTWDIRFADSIMKYVQQNITYASDPVGMDYWAPPADTLQARAGDCDDQALLIASMCLAIGIPARLRIVCNQNGANGHAFAEILAGTTDSTKVSRYDTPAAEPNIQQYRQHLRRSQASPDIVTFPEGTQVWMLADSIFCRHIGDAKEMYANNYLNKQTNTWYDTDVFYSAENLFDA